MTTLESASSAHIDSFPSAPTSTHSLNGKKHHESVQPKAETVNVAEKEIQQGLSRLFQAIEGNNNPYAATAYAVDESSLTPRDQILFGVGTLRHQIDHAEATGAAEASNIAYYRSELQRWAAADVLKPRKQLESK